jgi:tRNA (guanosine-2'-O-)-methyltransferase
MSGRRNRREPFIYERPHYPGLCNDHLILAPLWVAYGANLGTLLRTCDAVGACLALPQTAHYRQALAKGNTLPGSDHVHWIEGGKVPWLVDQAERGSRIIGIELDPDATMLADLSPASRRTVVLLGNETSGLPDEAWGFIDEVVEIPMVGRGHSLNVAVAGSLALYKLAGLT